MPPVKSLGNSRAQYNYKFGLTGLEAADPYVPTGPVYSDDVFSTYLYEGNKQESIDNPPTTQNIINGIDNVNNKGLIWQKTRSYTGSQTYTMSHYLTDTVRGAGNVVYADRDLQQTSEPAVANFYNNGFEVGSNNILNNSLGENVAWNFRAAPGFFDIQQYTGDGNNSQVIYHNLGCKPGMVMIKRTNGTGGDWAVYFKSGDNDTEVGYGVLNNNNGFTTSNIAFTSTAEYIRVYSGSFAIDANADGATYIMYIFAQGGADTDARKFGTNEDESIIKCGTWTANGGAATIDNLGWEPQFVLVKNVTDAGFWGMFDIMRGMPVGDADPYFSAHTDGVESSGTTNFIDPLPNGFKVSNLGSSQTFAYMAIRRPHKPITDPTKLFDLVLQNSANPNLLDISLSVADMVFHKQLNSTDGNSIQFADRMRGVKRLWPYDNLAETTDNNYAWDYNNKVQTSFYSPGNSQINHVFRRAPGFFDVVAYSGSNSSQTLNHNLGVKPALMICKRRNSTGNWQVYADIPNMGATKYMMLDDSAGAVANTNRWNDTEPTATQFTLGTYSDLNTSGGEYISYLFGNLPGVCKIGEYTSGSNAIDVDCGFNPRFVMIKRVDAGAGNWFVWHSINAGNDSYILLDDNVVGVSNTDWIDPISNGFQVAAVSTGISNHLNLSAAQPFLFMAIA